MERLDIDQFDPVYARMLFVSRRRTQAELADLLNLQQGSISEAKKRGAIPLPWCVYICDLFHVRMDWLRFGEPPVFMTEEMKEQETFLEAGLREPPPPPLETVRPGEVSVFSTVRQSDGSFPEAYTQVFPREFMLEGVKVFRLLERCMAPALNKGALVAVLPGAAVEDGDVVAVFGGSGLLFRRVFVASEGYDLRAERRDLAEDMHVAGADWAALYYGKAVWAFQPLWAG